MCFAAAADNVEGIHLLCEARANPRAKNMFGSSATADAATSGCHAALEEMIKQARPSALELSLAPYGAMARWANCGCLSYPWHDTTDGGAESTA